VEDEQAEDGVKGLRWGMRMQSLDLGLIRGMTAEY